MPLTPTVKRTITLSITVIDNEARVLDTALAAQLGMAEPRKIRQNVIEPNREELEAFGDLRMDSIQTGGRPAKAYYLNRQQALLVCILSKTEKAKAVRATSKRAVGAASTVPHGQAQRSRFDNFARGVRGTVRQPPEPVKAAR